MKRILVLFPNEWDHAEFSEPRYRDRYEFIYEGFDLFKFPENARLMTFNARRFIERMIKRYAGAGLDGVLSTDEHFGTMVAAIVAERLGLPGPDPESILIAQHKYYARIRAAEVAPEANPKFSFFPFTIKSPAGVGLPFPLYVKPVKATYSILARRVDDFAELRRHLTFHPFERLILKRLIAPFNALGAERLLFPVDAHHLVAEELMSGDQVTIEGIVHDGRYINLGVVDSIMYPGTNAFERFDYPSSLPESVQTRMAELAERLIVGFGFTHGFFNVEFFYQRETDRIMLIEVNPRMAYQFSDLREKVDGFNSYNALLAMTVGDVPKVVFGQGAYRYASSFVMRAFGQPKLLEAPPSAQVAAVQSRHQHSRIMVYIKKGASLARELKWLGSYRYAVINLGAIDRPQLFQRYGEVAAELPFRFAEPPVLNTLS
ncbi:MAG: ATP-grasp domain-containing protein [Burkholderiales bacterium]